MSATTTARAGQLLLPGQAAAPDGPVDLWPMWVLHHGFRRDLGKFVGAAAATPVSDRSTWQALADRWRLFATILHHHHSGEDAGLWPSLLDRVDASGDRAGRATLEAMSVEHSAIDPLLAETTAGFSRVAEVADEQARTALCGALVALRDHLDRHLAHEERDAMRLVQGHLSQADWDRIGTEYFDPAYSKREMLTLAAWVLHELPATAVARLRADPKGRPLVVLWRLFLRRPFERRELLAFRNAAGSATGVTSG
jgi:hemerythrin-like domain-containing protein